MNYYYTPNYSSGPSGTEIYLIVALVIAILGGIVLYFTFLGKRYDGKFTGFLGGLYDVLNFKKTLLEALLKISYLCLAIYVTLGSFVSIGSNFWQFLLTLVGGNILLRIIYEFSLLMILMYRNIVEINNKLGKKE